MLQNKITDVFFDLDHTLWDFDRNSSLAFARVFAKYDISLPLENFLREYEPINLVYWKKYRDGHINKEALRRGRLADAFAVFDLRFPVEIIDDLASCYIEELPVDNHLFDNTHEILEYLSIKYRLHIITNGFREVQHLKLKNSGINQFFQTVTTSEEVGFKKPHPSVFRAALQKASAAAESSVMIGDNLEADILGAQGVGMHSLYFNCRKEKISKSLNAIKTLSEIRDFL